MLTDMKARREMVSIMVVADSEHCRLRRPAGWACAVGVCLIMAVVFPGKLPFGVF